jgi:hypothetical protein
MLHHYYLVLEQDLLFLPHDCLIQHPDHQIHHHQNHHFLQLVLDYFHHHHHHLVLL